jgi:hypothetical protein
VPPRVPPVPDALLLELDEPVLEPEEWDDPDDPDPDWRLELLLSSFLWL